jgi:hypothetical protein
MKSELGGVVGLFEVVQEQFPEKSWTPIIHHLYPICI